MIFKADRKGRHVHHAYFLGVGDVRVEHACQTSNNSKIPTIPQVADTNEDDLAPPIPGDEAGEDYDYVIGSVCI